MLKSRNNLVPLEGPYATMARLALGVSSVGLLAYCLPLSPSIITT